jgi:excisionase family DNA binding protein
MTVQEAAWFLDVSTKTVYELCSRRLLSHTRVGTGRGMIRISREDLDAYLAPRRVEAVEPGRRAAAPPRGTGLAVRDYVGEEIARQEEVARRREEKKRLREEKERAGSGGPPPGGGRSARRDSNKPA